MDHERSISANQRILAKMKTLEVIDRVRYLSRPSAQQQLLTAIEEAIADARRRQSALELLGQAGTGEYLNLCTSIARWEEARRRNR